MFIAVPKETKAGETRISATPETVKKYCAAGCEVLVQQGAGDGSSIADAAFREAGAAIVARAADLYRKADVVLKVRGPEAAELEKLGRGTTVIGMFSPFTNPLLADYAGAGLTCFVLEMVPRISRAQNMDVLSSQANIAGYKAVLMATEHYRHFMPMMMTAAGTVTPAHVLVMGAGVAGLQAIATAHRLGAVVEAFDVRPAVKEQVESLGAKFVEVEGGEEAEDTGGYAKEMSEEYRRRQAAMVDEHAVNADIIITTALIPGRPAPVLVSKKVVQGMKPGSVIVDLAAEMGGNCELTEPDAVITKHDVTIIGETNIPALMAADASQLYARNVFNFLAPMLGAKDEGLNIDLEDEVIEASLLCRDGEMLKPQFAGKGESG